MNYCGEIQEKYTQNYRTPDNINNFKLRIKISEGSFLPDKPRKAVVGRLEGESKVFCWQQKVYGKYEREFYKNPKNCVTDLEKKYHSDVIKLVQTNDGVLFSYTDDDAFSQIEEISVVNSKRTSELCKQVTNMKFQSEDSLSTKNYGRFSYKRSLINSLNNPYGDLNNFQVMHIMADLGEYVGDSWLKSEYILCSIKYDHTRNFLQIFPDFTNSEPYHIQIEGDTKRMLRYYIQDVSEKMSLDALLKENEILNKIVAHQTKLKIEKTGSDFELPAKNRLDVHLFLEILTGQNFEYNDIYVQYFIDLPENWFCQNRSSLIGTTQSSHSKNNLFYFGFPIDVCLEYNLKEIRKHELFRAPFIYFEVISKDSWDRFRTEGLTYTILPISQPGIYDYNLQCLRISPQGVVGSLRRFFLGDCASYNDLTWISMPKDYSKKTINKYGVNTITAGELNIRVNVLHQSKAPMADGDGTSNQKQKFVFEKLNMSAFVKSIEQVLAAFKVAKQKMIEARRDV